MNSKESESGCLLVPNLLVIDPLVFYPSILVDMHLVSLILVDQSFDDIVDYFPSRLLE